MLLIDTIRAWLRFRRAGAPEGLRTALSLALRQNLDLALVDGIIEDRREGYGLGQTTLEAHHLAGGDVTALIRGAARLKEAGVTESPLPLGLADLNGRSVDEAVDRFLEARRTYPQLSLARAIAIQLEGRG
jgi:uncharacterized protein YqfA (UPF0365 family)